LTIATLVFATFVVSAAGGLVPVINVELWLLGVSATCPSAALLPLVLAASLGQLAAKCVLYLGGDAALPTLRRRPRAAAAVQKLEGRGSLGTAMVLGSALLGLPPLYVVSVVAGLVRFPLARFAVLTFTGRVLRFAFVFALPRLLVTLGPGR
jgi:membrane protein YqaA with SNARE-associated domain